MEKWLDVPLLSQGKGTDWCGRAASSMVYNYYQLVKSEAGGKSEEYARKHFIINNLVEKQPGRPDDLIYPDGEIAALRWSARRKKHIYALKAPLLKAMEGWDGDNDWNEEEAKSGWGSYPSIYLFPGSNHPKSRRAGPLPGGRTNKREEYRPWGGSKELSDENIRTDILAPLLTSIDKRNPVVAYTRLSGTSSALHIVVVSGYRIKTGGDLWLRICDPASITKGSTKRLNIGDEHLEVLDPGVDGASYWLEARRLLEKQQATGDPNDLWCDHPGRPGFAVFLNDEYETPDSRYATGGAPTPIYHPLPPGFEPEALSTAEDFARLYPFVEEASEGGFFPVGTNGVWHGGVHLEGRRMATSGLSTPVYAPLPGRIVAARLAWARDETEGALGSANFVLTYHEPGRDGMPPAAVFGGRPFYMLFMHLDPIGPDLEQRRRLSKERAYTPLYRAGSTPERHARWLLWKNSGYEVGRVPSHAHLRTAPGWRSTRALSRWLCTLRKGTRFVKLGEARDPDGDRWWKVRLLAGQEVGRDEASPWRSGPPPEAPPMPEAPAPASASTAEERGHYHALRAWMGEVRAASRSSTSDAAGLPGAAREDPLLMPLERLAESLVHEEVFVPGLARDNDSNSSAPKTEAEVPSPPTDPFLLQRGEGWLLATEQARAGMALEAVEWDVPRLDLLARLSGGAATALDEPIEAGAVLGRVGRHDPDPHCAETPAARGERLHWEVFTPGAEPPLWQALCEADGAKALFSNRLASHAGVERRVDEQLCGSPPSSADEDARGKTQRTRRPWPRQSWQERLMAGGAPRTAEDLNENFHLDGKKVQGLFERLDTDRSGALEPEELRAFYTTGAGREEMRSWACRHMSEWGLPDAERAVRELMWDLSLPRWMKARFGGAEDERWAALLEPYLWWQKAREAQTALTAEAAAERQRRRREAATLPTDARVWHYHPLVVLALLGWEQEACALRAPAQVKSVAASRHVLEAGASASFQAEMATANPADAIRWEVVGLPARGATGEDVLYRQAAGTPVLEWTPGPGAVGRRVRVHAWSEEEEAGGMARTGTAKSSPPPGHAGPGQKRPADAASAEAGPVQAALAAVEGPAAAVAGQKAHFRARLKPKDPAGRLGRALHWTVVRLHETRDDERPAEEAVHEQRGRTMQWTPGPRLAGAQVEVRVRRQGGAPSSGAHRRLRVSEKVKPITAERGHAPPSRAARRRND